MEKAENWKEQAVKKVVRKMTEKTNALKKALAKVMPEEENVNE